MKPALLMFATREGQTGKIARRIAELLPALGKPVELVDAADRKATDRLTLTDFEPLIFGASMHAGGLESELVRFINENRAIIEPCRRSFFLVLLSAATADPKLKAQWLADARAKLDSQLEVRFDEIEMIAGALSYSKYSWPMKWMMRRIARQAGADTDIHRDYEYTDWNQVEAFARRLAGNPDDS